MIFSVLAWVVVAVPVLLLCWLSIELAFGLKALTFEDKHLRSSARVAVLVPAHDEDKLIAATVSSCARAAPSARILVVADNCSDDTAPLARAAGVEVVERHDRERRGKGYALAFGREALMDNPPDVVIVLDADCQLLPGSAEILARRVMETQRPAQATYLLASSPYDTPLVAISNFAMLVKNLVRARGMQRLGRTVMLYGTGMAFPWRSFVQLPLESGEAVEDLAISLAHVREGGKIDLVDRAKVISTPAALADTRGQRTRWEHGFLQVGTRVAIPTFLEGLFSANRAKAIIGLHLAVPPLALLMLLSVLALVFAWGAVLLGATTIPAVLLTILLAVVTSLLLLAWWLEGRAVLPLRQLALAPIYALWKIPIYATLFLRRERQWNKTPRQ